VSCAACREWFYEPPHWRLKRNRRVAGEPPMKRPKGTPTPCDQCPKIPLPLAPGQTPRPALAVELSEQNRRCYEHYRECAAVNWQCDDAADPLVRRHAAMIGDVIEQVERERQQAALGVLGPLAALLKPPPEPKGRRG
jgi:hypothetical protein